MHYISLKPKKGLEIIMKITYRLQIYHLFKIVNKLNWHLRFAETFIVLSPYVAKTYAEIRSMSQQVCPLFSSNTAYHSRKQVTCSTGTSEHDWYLSEVVCVQSLSKQFCCLRFRCHAHMICITILLFGQQRIYQYTSKQC